MTDVNTTHGKRNHYFQTVIFFIYHFVNLKPRPTILIHVAKKNKKKLQNKQSNKNAMWFSWLKTVQQQQQHQASNGDENGE